MNMIVGGVTGSRHILTRRYKSQAEKQDEKYHRLHKKSDFFRTNSMIAMIKDDGERHTIDFQLRAPKKALTARPTMVTAISTLPFGLEQAA